jgi:hypothetical protein
LSEAITLVVREQRAGNDGIEHQVDDPPACFPTEDYFIPRVLHANIHKIRLETLIMKFPFLCAVCLLLAIITVLAGCSSTPSVPVTGTPVQSVRISQLALLPSEMPFVAMTEQTKNPDMNDPTISNFGGIQGYTKFSMNEKENSPTSVQLGQTIVEYPPGKAALAFADFVKSNRETDPRYKISWLLDPGIGDQSCALSIINRNDTTKTTAMIVFVKSNIMESVVMIAPSPDIDALTRAAKLAAAKIP